jgi:SAM-dependent methyltransferase
MENQKSELICESSNKNTVLDKNPIVKTFFRIKFRRIIRFADLNKKELILDFGCGDGWLKKMLKGYNVIGYDLNPKQTEIADFRTLKPSKIFLIDVFEHLSLDHIREILSEFKKMNPSVEIITSIPTENFPSRKMRKLVGKPERAIDHITSLKEMWPLLNNEMFLIKKENFLTVALIAKFRMKPNLSFF